MADYITNLTPGIHGKRIRCTIQGEPIDDAVIIHVVNSYYVLQNKKFGSGSTYAKSYPYKGSWGIFGCGPIALARVGVANIEIVPESPIVMNNYSLY